MTHVQLEQLCLSLPRGLNPEAKETAITHLTECISCREKLEYFGEQGGVHEKNVG